MATTEPVATIEPSWMVTFFITTAFRPSQTRLCRVTVLGASLMISIRSRSTMPWLSVPWIRMPSDHKPKAPIFIVVLFKATRPPLI